MSRNEARRIARDRRERTIRAAKYGSASDAVGTLKPECEVYVLTFGQFSLVQALVAILKQTGPADVDIATWTAAHAHLTESADLLRVSKIRSLRWLVDRSFATRQPEYCRRMRAMFGDGCIRTLRSHAKFMTIRGGGWNLAVRTSMNLNENPRLECLEISDDAALCAFLVGVVDGVFEEHAEGDYAAGIPDLQRVENVAVAGRVEYGRASVGGVDL